MNSRHNRSRSTKPSHLFPGQAKRNPTTDIIAPPSTPPSHRPKPSNHPLRKTYKPQTYPSKSNSSRGETKMELATNPVFRPTKPTKIILSPGHGAGWVS